MFIVENADFIHFTIILSVNGVTTSAGEVLWFLLFVVSVVIVM